MGHGKTPQEGPPRRCPGAHRAGGLKVWFCADTCPNGRHLVKVARPGSICKIVHAGYPPLPKLAHVKKCGTGRSTNQPSKVFHPPSHALWCMSQPTPGYRRTCRARQFAWSPLGSRCFFAGTAGTTVDNHPNPLSPLRKSVPAGCGDKPEISGDSGDNSFRAGAGRSCRPAGVAERPVRPGSGSRVVGVADPGQGGGVGCRWLRIGHRDIAASLSLKCRANRRQHQGCVRSAAGNLASLASAYQIEPGSTACLCLVREGFRIQGE